MIDKITPLKFVSDKDERLVKPNEMIEAQNVTISLRGEGSEVIVKTVKGVVSASPDTGQPNLSASVKVIGAIADEQRGKVYMFLAGNEGTAVDSIIQIDPSTNKYKVVFSTNALNFGVSTFIKADVVNKAFQQDGVLQTILYFTDNVNPPKKINVDEALDGRYDSMSSDELDFALSVIRPAIQVPPLPTFTTDYTVEINNFKSEVFQFSTQLVYRDGEESVLSPYSKLAVPRGRFFDMLEGSANGSFLYEDNICEIDCQYDQSQFNQETSDKKEVRLMRLYGRKGNTGDFFLIDEFDPNKNLVRHVYGTADYVVYNADTSVYRFFNDKVGATVDNVLATKNYDNVPLKAQGQAVAGSRLMYSNYSEGYPNHDVSDVTLTVQYSDTNETSTVHIDNSDKNDVIDEYTTGNALGQIEINLTGGDAFGAGANGSTSVPSGTHVQLRFGFNPVGSVKSEALRGSTAFAGIPMLTVQFYSGNANVNDAGFLVTGYEGGGDATHPIPNTVPLISADEVGIVKIDYVTSEDLTVSELGSKIRNVFTGKQAVNTYDYETSDGLEFSVAGGSATREAKGKMSITWRFDKITSHPSPECGNGHFFITPEVQAVDASSLKVRNHEDNAFLSVRNAGISSVNDWIGGGNSEYGPLYGPPDNEPNRSSALTNALRPNHPVDPLVGDSNFKQTTLVTTNTTAYTTEKTTLAESFGFAGSFKRGASHDFGIVYLDKWGRSSFVNKVGSVFVKPYASSGASEVGSVSVLMTVPDALTPPTWAEFWQPVYTGNTTYDSFVQYTTGGGYAKQKGAPGSRSVDTNSKQIYVSLDTLTKYQSEKSSLREYEFTKGDRLRVLSYDSANSATESVTYAKANPSASGSNPSNPMEFEVVGFVELDGTVEGNPIYTGNPSTEVADEFQGKFVILESSIVASGAVDPDIDDNIKYPGFDWYSITGTDYPGGDTSSSNNFWGRRSIVEILTPSTSTRSLYYEIGEVRPIVFGKVQGQRTHGSAVISSGDVYFRPVACKTNFYDSGWAPQNLDNYRYQSEMLESSNISDKTKTEDWNKGRSHVAFERAAEVNRYNSITYSEAYEDDVSKLSLSSFTPSLANFFDLPSEQGSCPYISSYFDRLLAVQENKCSLIGVNKDVIQTGSGSGIVSLSTDVLKNIEPIAQDVGTTKPSSVLVRDSMAFFVDDQRQVVCMLKGRDLKMISKNDINSFFQAKFGDFESQDGSSVVSGYDPDDNIYYVTLEPSGTFEGLTLGFNVVDEFWQGTYTFLPDMYATIKDTMLMGQYVDLVSDGGTSDTVVHFQTSTTSNRFPGSGGSSEESKVTVVSTGLTPSMVKVYESISIEGDSDWTTTLESSNGQTTANLSFSEKEDAFYANVSGDTSSNSTRHILPVGTIESIDSENNTITLKNSLRGYHIPKGYSLTKATSPSAVSQADNPITDVNHSTSTITVDSVASFSVDDRVFASSQKQLNGDQVRGHYCKIKCSITPSVDQTKELYAINAFYTESKANHAKQ
jgi:hypothetical protein